jgi:hypothetical protein
LARAARSIDDAIGDREPFECIEQPPARRLLCPLAVADDAEADVTTNLYTTENLEMYRIRTWRRSVWRSSGGS